MNAAFPYLRRKQQAKPVPPEPHRLMPDIDAAFAKNILDLAQPLRIPDLHHHREANRATR